MKSNSSKEKEFTALISVLRAIVNSRKQPCLLSAVLKDYYEVECRQLPYREYGCNAAVDLFSRSGEFIIRPMGGEIYIAAKRNDKSGHISDFVRQQKSSGRTTHLTKTVTAPSRLNYSKYASQQNKPSYYRPAKQPISQPPRQNQNQNFSPLELKYQLEKQLQHQLQYELEKQKKQLQLNFDKEKENLKKEFLAEFRAASINLKNKNDANNNCAESKQQSKAISVELNKLKERIDLLESASNEAENSLVVQEIKENRLMTAELKQLKDRLFLLSSDTEHNMSTKKQQSITEQSPRKQQIKDKSTRSQTEAANDPTTTNRPLNTSTQHSTTRPNNIKPNNADNNSGLPPTDLRHRLNAMRLQNENKNLRPILGQFNNVQQEIGADSDNNNRMPQKVSQAPKQHFQQELNVPQNRQIAPTPMQESYPQIQQQPSRFFPKQPSVQNRLKLNTNCDKKAVNGNQPPVQPVTVVPGPLIKPQMEKSRQHTRPKTLSVSSNQKVWKFDPTLDPCTSIALYCADRKYGEPKYDVFRSRQGLYDCQLTINSNTIYSTYPKEYTSEAKARYSCAEQAIQQIQISEARKLLPTFSNDKEFLDVLYKELLLHPNGIISNKMSEWFVDKFGYTLPEHWFMLIKKSARFIIEDGIKESTFIILAKEGAENDDDNAFALEEAVPIQSEPLKLPWSERAWELYITHCVSTVEIWAHLLGAEYNVRLEALMAEINGHMSKEKVRPDVIAPNHIYLVEQRSCWYRVRAESLDKENQKTLCFYIDFGDTAYFSVSELYLCAPKFLCLPPQAVPFSLFGLEDLAGYPSALKDLEQRLLNRCVVSEVVTKQSDFEAHGVIQAVMFDTQTDDDINLNVLLQEEICNQWQLPQLKGQGTIPVYITNIDETNGDISLKVVNPDSEYVHKTLKQIVESKLNEKQHRCLPEELLRPQMLLVHDDDNNIEWCRAKLFDPNQARNVVNGRDEMIEVLYVDYNIRRRVNISKIYRLESLSKALTTFPSQVIRVKLYNISEFSEKIIGRMRALLPTTCQAFVRVEVAEEVPYVTILRRVYGPDMPYCNINDDLRLEIER